MISRLLRVGPSNAPPFCSIDSAATAGVNGVRSSWLSTARKWSLALLASSAARLAAWSSASARFKSSMFSATPNQRPTPPEASRIGSPITLNHSYSPSCRLTRYSRSYGAVPATAARHAAKARGRSSGWSSLFQPSPRCSLTGTPVYFTHCWLW